MAYDDKSFENMEFDVFEDMSVYQTPQTDRAFYRIISNSIPVVMLIAVLMVLSACSTASPSPKDIVGMDQRDVRQCMGSPTRTAELGTRQIWSYESKAPQSARRQYASANIPPAEINAMPGEFQTTSCVLHVEFKKGHARDVSYYVNTEGRPGDKDKRCAFMASRCGD
jgi:hypothetical protein